MAGHGGRTGTLKGRERELAALLASGCRHTTAAEQLGVKLRTVERWAVKAEVKRLIAEFRDDRVQGVIDRLGDAGNDAVTTLRALLKSKSGMVQLGAARALLEYLLRGREHVELNRRVADLERDEQGESGEPSGSGDEAGGESGGPPTEPAPTGDTGAAAV